MSMNSTQEFSCSFLQMMSFNWPMLKKYYDMKRILRKRKVGTPYEHRIDFNDFDSYVCKIETCIKIFDEFWCIRIVAVYEGIRVINNDIWFFLFCLTVVHLNMMFNGSYFKIESDLSQTWLTTHHILPSLAESCWPRGGGGCGRI